LLSTVRQEAPGAHRENSLFFAQSASDIDADLTRDWPTHLQADRVGCGSRRNVSLSAWLSPGGVVRRWRRGPLYRWARLWSSTQTGPWSCSACNRPSSR